MPYLWYASTPTAPVALDKAYALSLWLARRDAGRLCFAPTDLPEHRFGLTPEWPTSRQLAEIGVHFAVDHDRRLTVEVCGSFPLVKRQSCVGGRRIRLGWQQLFAQQAARMS